MFAKDSSREDLEKHIFFQVRLIFLLLHLLEFWVPAGRSGSYKMQPVTFQMYGGIISLFKKLDLGYLASAPDWIKMAPKLRIQTYSILDLIHLTRRSNLFKYLPAVWLVQPGQMMDLHQMWNPSCMLANLRGADFLRCRIVGAGA